MMFNSGVDYDVHTMSIGIDHSAAAAQTFVTIFSPHKPVRDVVT